MTREKILDGLYEIKNWKCNGDAKMHEVVTEAIKALEQEPILDKIRAEIVGLTYYWCEVNPNSVKEDVLEIIDKYKAESEG